MTRTFKTTLILTICLLIGAICQGAPAPSQPDLAPFFAGYEGTFVLFDETAGEYLVYNLPRSEKRFTPCSTFKIINSLIALETGVAPDETMVIPWNGKPGFVKSWDRDHTMSSAIANSVVWYYQELATHIGAERMQQHLNAIPYGNRDISGGLTEFWLVSSLEISAMEQVDIMRRLFRDELPFSKKNMAIVRRMIRQDSAANNFYGKTGSGRINDVTSIGWFVGAVEKEGGRYFFATNISGSQDATGIKARTITIEILKATGLL